VVATPTVRVAGDDARLAAALSAAGWRLGGEVDAHADADDVLHPAAVEHELAARLGILLHCACAASSRPPTSLA
jgi:hypothetical protein